MEEIRPLNKNELDVFLNLIDKKEAIGKRSQALIDIDTSTFRQHIGRLLGGDLYIEIKYDFSNQGSLT